MNDRPLTRKELKVANDRTQYRWWLSRVRGKVKRPHSERLVCPVAELKRLQEDVLKAMEWNWMEDKETWSDEMRLLASTYWGKDYDAE